jgi:hypothetical protein
MRTLKHFVYVTCFAFFGVVVQFLLRAFAEIFYLRLLARDFEHYSFGLSWEQMTLIHNVAAILLFLFGAYWGYTRGEYWWKKIYHEHK